jgi:hypothetical protein
VQVAGVAILAGAVAIGIVVGDDAMRRGATAPPGSSMAVARGASEGALGRSP